MDSLWKLNLTGNKILIIYELSTFTGLSELYLDNNDLKTLTYSKKFPILKFLVLMGIVITWLMMVFSMVWQT